eukprot:365702-Chlamydomonas_euryale.AAC.11
MRFVPPGPSYRKNGLLRLFYLRLHVGIAIMKGDGQLPCKACEKGLQALQLPQTAEVGPRFLPARADLVPPQCGRWASLASEAEGLADSVAGFLCSQSSSSRFANPRFGNLLSASFSELNWCLQKQ